MSQSKLNSDCLVTELNDQFRREMCSKGYSATIPGKLVFTAGITALSVEQQTTLLNDIYNFKDFTPDNDPYGKHDFGKITLAGVGDIFWKIDYYDTSLEFGSESPADTSKTVRVLTPMLVEEY